MSRQSTIERAAQLPGKPGLVCIGRFSVDGEPVDFAYSEDDLRRDAAFWARVLAGYGVTRGKRVVVTALPWEISWSIAVRYGVKDAGGTFSNVELWGWDARRLDLFLRRTDPHGIVGPGRELLDGLGGIVDLDQRLSGLPLLLVRPDGIEALAESGIRPTGIVAPIGPALAVSLPDGDGLAVDPAEWRVDESDGELLISTVGPRATLFDRERTGVAGRVVQTGNGPRILLDE